MGRRMRFLQAVALALAVPVILAYVYVNTGVALQGNPQYGLIDSYVFQLSTALGLLLVAGYYLRRGDVTETLALAVVLFWGLYMGWQDLWVYIFIGDPVPGELPWLETLAMGRLADLLGFTVMDGTGLWVSVVVSGLLTGLLVYGLYRLEVWGL